jgi:hypothetical protein
MLRSKAKHVFWVGSKSPSPLRGMLRGRSRLMRNRRYTDAAKHGTLNP